VRKLEKQGVIQGYRALLDSCQLGIHMKVWLLVQLHGLSASHVLTFKKAIDHLPAVITCIQVMGNADFLLQVVTKDMYSYKDFLENELSNIEQIKNIVAMPVVYSMKEKGLPLLNKFQKNTKPQN
jgi:Lrp/AsnC family leucine-responsive transcriptional regulator